MLLTFPNNYSASHFRIKRRKIFAWLISILFTDWFSIKKRKRFFSTLSIHHPHSSPLSITPTVFWYLSHFFALALIVLVKRINYITLICDQRDIYYWGNLWEIFLANVHGIFHILFLYQFYVTLNQRLHILCWRWTQPELYSLFFLSTSSLSYINFWHHMPELSAIVTIIIHCQRSFFFTLAQSKFTTFVT